MAKKMICSSWAENSVLEPRRKILKMLAVSVCEQGNEISHHMIVTRAFLYWQLLGKIQVKVILICLTDEVTETWTDKSIRLLFWVQYNWYKFCWITNLRKMPWAASQLCGSWEHWLMDRDGPCVMMILCKFDYLSYVNFYDLM